MEKIYRQINLEQARNRLVNMLPYYYVNKETNTCDLVQNKIANKYYKGDKYSWCGYCTDILFPLISDSSLTVSYRWATDLKDIYNFPIYDIEVKGVVGKKQYLYVRYKNIMSLYYWLMNEFIPSITFYKKCKSGLKLIKTKDRKKIFETDIPIYNNLNDVDVEELDLGDIIGVTPLFVELEKRFIDVDTVKRFLTTIKTFRLQGVVSPLIPASAIGEAPYMDVSFSITANGSDMGSVTPIIEEWVPKKRYYLGDYVTHDGKIWRLMRTKLGDVEKSKYELIEVDGELLDTILADTGNIKYKVYNNVRDIPSSAYYIKETTNLRDRKEYVIKTGDKYYLFYPYFDGYYDSNIRKVFFDATLVKTVRLGQNSENSSYWMEITIYHEGVRGALPDETEYTGVTESKLLSLKRRVVSVDDYGEILPFIIQDDDPNNEFGQILYMFGVVNKVKNDDGTYSGDELIQIRYKNSGEETWEVIDPSVIYPNSEHFGVGGIIEFTYIIGGIYDENDIYTTCTGVKYVEEWNYKKKSMAAIIDGSEHTFDYIEFTPIIIEDEIAGNLDIGNKKPIYSIVTYYEKSLKKTNSLPCDYIKEEELLGIQDINTLEYDYQSRRYVSSINAYIERGKAGAFERHQILGEVKTFADLENYRNNFFEI